MTTTRCPERPGGVHMTAANGICRWCGAQTTITTTEVIL